VLPQPLGPRSGGSPALGQASPGHREFRRLAIPRTIEGSESQAKFLQLAESASEHLPGVARGANSGTYALVISAEHRSWFGRARQTSWIAIPEMSESPSCRRRLNTGHGRLHNKGPIPSRTTCGRSRQTSRLALASRALRSRGPSAARRRERGAAYAPRSTKSGGTPTRTGDEHVSRGSAWETSVERKPGRRGIHPGLRR
jgi:hypothetical protein